MKVYLINLKKDTERMAAADAQLKRLEISYERIDAVYAKELPKDSIEQAVNGFRWWCAMGRPIAPGEIGCAMSHYSIYKQISEPVCVLEDDVILDDGFPVVLSQVEKWINAADAKVVLLSNHSSETGSGITESKGDMYAEGYVITPSAARALLNANWPLQVPCDHWGRWVRMGIIRLYHAFPTVCRQDQSQYVSGTVDGSAYNVARLSLIRKLLHKVKRMIGLCVDCMLLTLERK